MDGLVDLHMKASPSPGNSIAFTLRYRNQVGKLAAVASAIAEVGGSISDVTVVCYDHANIVRRIIVNTTDESHAQVIADTIKSVDGVEVLETCDCTFKLHECGKLEITPKAHLKTYVDLSMAYTPGVARVCQAIYDNPDAARKYTIKCNTVGVVTDGTAVLGLGNIGATAALPVMEGKAVLFKEFGGVNAFPICVDTKDKEILIQTAIAVSATFGGINLEDIAAPDCFEVERRVSQAVDIPVFHDDQHGTAVVVGSAFINAVRVTGKNPANMRAVVVGAGAAGVACTRTLLDLGIGDVVVCDRKGAIYRGRGDSGAKAWLAEKTNKQNMQGSLRDVLKGADLLLGLSGPDILSGDDVRTMAEAPIVFALSNPTPEVPPEEIADYAAVVATGRSDYPNQINNVLCFPGLFRGLLDSGAKKVTREMLTAAAKAIASTLHSDELSRDCIIPSVFDDTVAGRVSQAVVDVVNNPNLPETPIYFEF